MARPTHCKFACDFGAQAMLDPGAAAEVRQRKAARKAAGRKRKLEDVQRRRGAGLPVKNRRRERQ